MHIDDFRSLITDFYVQHKRILPWREQITPYGVFLSEVMLQQTQVPRVLVKYPEFVERFPSFTALATAPTSNVLATWQGMGYNRRGLYLQRSAQIIMNEYQGVLPKSAELVDQLPGIGPATAAAIITYTYNIPTVFIETNIRRVFIHHFFQDQEGIDDKDILPLVEKTVNQNNPRDWYYALMDYGTYLARQVANPNRKSRHYAVQSKFEGSNRQVRGALLKLFVTQNKLSYNQLPELLSFEKERIDTALSSLVKDGFLVQDKSIYKLKSEE